jgi:hypothetical protein
MYDLNSLPDAVPTPDGLITAAMYRLSGDCFLGLPQGPPSLFVEGSEIVTELQPNDNFVPLNKAAARRFNDWEAGLPPAGVAINHEDLTSAALIVSRKYARIDPPDSAIWYAEVYEQAVQLRAMREGRRIPAPATRPQGGSAAAAPMTNLDENNFKNLAHPGEAGMPGQRQAGPLAAKRTRQVTPT